MNIQIQKIITVLLIFAGVIFLAAVGIFYFRKSGQPPAEEAPLVGEAQIPPEGRAEEAPIILPDPDADGLTDEEEKTLGTDPENRDTDGDGLIDGAEIKLKHDPKVKDFNLGNVDSDKDGLTDDEESFLGTDPNKSDTDEDGVSDLGEIDSGTDPLTSDEWPEVEREVLNDTDQDQLFDEIEITLGTDPKKADTDSDELNDYEEARLFFTDPFNPDTDGDGYKDGEEVRAGYNPKGSGKL